MMSFLQNLVNDSSVKDMVQYNPNKEGDYTVVVSNLNGLATVTLKLIMYRLSNINGKVRIFLLDKKSVTQKDIDSGTFTDDDFGKFRTDVFIQKVAVNFDITTVDVIKTLDFNELMFKNDNIIFLDFIEGSSNNKDVFEKLLRNKNFNRFTTNNMYIEVDNTKNYDSVTVDCYSRRTYENKNEKQTYSYRSNTSKRVRDAVLSRVVSGVVNIMVTDDFYLSKNRYQFTDTNKIETQIIKEM